jgi:hypothetical protein
MPGPAVPLYGKTIANNAMTVAHVRAEAAHKSRLDNYPSFKAAEHGVVKFFCDIVNKV